VHSAVADILSTRTSATTIYSSRSSMRCRGRTTSDLAEAAADKLYRATNVTPSRSAAAGPTGVHPLTRDHAFRPPRRRKEPAATQGSAVGQLGAIRPSRQQAQPVWHSTSWQQTPPSAVATHVARHAEYLGGFDARPVPAAARSRMESESAHGAMMSRQPHTLEPRFPAPFVVTPPAGPRRFGAATSVPPTQLQRCSRSTVDPKPDDTPGADPDSTEAPMWLAPSERHSQPLMLDKPSSDDVELWALAQELPCLLELDDTVPSSGDTTRPFDPTQMCGNTIVASVFRPRQRIQSYPYPGSFQDNDALSKCTTRRQEQHVSPQQPHGSLTGRVGVTGIPSSDFSGSEHNCRPPIHGDYSGEHASALHPVAPQCDTGHLSRDRT
jgi:hypothetical protein